MKKKDRDEIIAKIECKKRFLYSFAWNSLFAVNNFLSNKENHDLITDQSLETLSPITRDLKRLGYSRDVSSKGDNFNGWLHEGLSLIYNIFIKGGESLEWQEKEIKTFLKVRYPDISDDVVAKLVLTPAEISGGLNRKLDPESKRNFHKGGAIQAAYHAVAIFWGYRDGGTKPRDTKTVEKWVLKWRNAPKIPWHGPLTQRELNSLLSTIYMHQQLGRYQKDKHDFPNSTDEERQTRVQQDLKNDFNFIQEINSGKHSYVELAGTQQIREKFGLIRLETIAGKFKKSKKRQ